MSFKIIGYVGKSFGLEGKFFLSKPRLDAMALRSLKYIYVGNGVEPDDVLAIRSVEERGSRLCIQLDTITTREQADRLTHSALFATEKQAAKLINDEPEISFKGFQVIQDGVLLGVVSDWLHQPMQDIITFTAMNGSEVMIPFVDEFIESVDEKKGILRVHLLEGMLNED
jgi:16S rRNA processing protein RimM